MSGEYTPGWFKMAWTDAEGARDQTAIVSQVKELRDVFEHVGLKPALLLVVVADGEEDAAADLITLALDPSRQA